MQFFLFQYNLRSFQAYGYTFLQGHENGFGLVHPETAQAWENAHQELGQVNNPFSYASMLAQAMLYVILFLLKFFLQNITFCCISRTPPDDDEAGAGGE